MKKYFILLLFLFFYAVSCRKENSIKLKPVTTNKDSLTLEEVKDWYNGQTDSVGTITQTRGKALNLRLPAFDWAKASNVHDSKHNWWVIALPGQVTYKGAKQGYRKLAFMRDSSGNIQARVLELIPDAAYLHIHHGADTKTFTGYEFVYDQNYHLLKGMIFHNGKQVGVIKPKPTATIATTAVTPNESMARTDMVAIVESCDWADDNYIDGDGIVTIYSYQVCGYDFVGDGGGGGGIGVGGTTFGDPLGSGGGGGGTEGTAPSKPAMLPGQNKTAIDPKAYMNCFGSLPDIGSKETVTVYVEEPQPGLPFNYGINSVGHTAISLSKSYGGQTITQTVGFYPTSTLQAATGTASKMVDNSGLEYNVSITYEVQPFEFNAIANYIANPPSTYNLYTFNCTNFVYSACQQGNITLPDPNGNVGMFQTGMTPAALGSSISDLAGYDDVNTNGGEVGESHGPCN